MGQGAGLRMGLAAFAVAAWVLPAAAALAETRPPNAFEEAYSAMALDFGDHTLCEKISPEAETRLLFNSPGTQIYRERSRCFLHAAGSTLNPWLCRFVEEAAAPRHDGSYFSRKNCEAIVAAGNAFTFSVSFDHAAILAAMGYAAEEIARAHPGLPDDEAALNFYLHAVGRDGVFQQRLKRLPDYAGESR